MSTADAEVLLGTENQAGPEPPPAARRLGGYSSRGIAMLALVGSRVATIVVASFLIFAALSLAPGDPVDRVLGERASPAARAAVRHDLGLDQPLLERYWHWLTGAVHGDFGQSIIFKSDVSALLSARLVTTLMLVTYAGVLIIVIGIVLGTAGGLSRRLGPIVAGISGVMLGIPGFVAAQLLVALLALRWGWFPVQGEGTGFSDRLYHLTMPALALAIPVSAWVAQVTMTAVRDERGREHVDTARGRGIAPGKTVRRHVLRNAALPMVTVSGLAVASLFAGAVVIEQAFNLAGIGSLLVDAVGSKDYNVVLAVSIILVAVFVVVTSVIDVLHVLLDPRIRRGPAK